MSNIDVARRCLEAIQARDVETLQSLSTDDVRVSPLRAMVEDTVYVGRAGIEQWIRDIGETWIELSIDVESIEEPVPDSVIALATLHGRGHGSSVPASMHVAMTARLRDGLVCEARTWADRAEAMRDAGGGG